MAEDALSKIVSLAKRRGFVFQGSEIYGGLAGFWDYGPYGAELAHNIKELWWDHFVREQENMFGLSTSILMPEAVWSASGHLEWFADPLVQCKKCNEKFRADEIGFGFGGNPQNPRKALWRIPTEKNCPNCGIKIGKDTFKSPLMSNMMFKTSVGVMSGNDDNGPAYLRPEVAQGMFVNFKNVVDSIHPDLPFGLAQIGRAFRNEIAPRDFLFRVREFDLMEFEYFVKEQEWERWFEYWKNEMWKWIERVGIDKKMVHELEVGEGDRAHYSKRTIDFEFEYPFGKKELYGLAYRGDYDLEQHKKASKVDLRYTDPASQKKFIPHVIEPTFGLGRTMLAVLLSAYREDEMDGETRVFLKLRPEIAPIKVAVFPLLRNKPELVQKAREIYRDLKADSSKLAAVFDDNGNIGKRYRRQDEIGTPHCVTIDFETLENDTVTVRDRDTGTQERVASRELASRLRSALKN